MTAKAPVDKGWAWVVMGANTVINYLLGILIYSTGIVNVALLDRFQADVTTTSWAGGVIVALRYLGAPLSTLVVHNFGCRASIMMGGFLLFTGCMASTFASSVWHIFFAYGLVGGFGVALALQPVLLSVVFNFQKYRGLVSGVCQCGIAVGILTGPQIIQRLLDTFGLSGMFLLLGAIQLHVVPMGALLRPTEHDGKRLRDKQMAKTLVRVSVDESCAQEADAKTGLQNVNGRHFDLKINHEDSYGMTARSPKLNISTLQKQCARSAGVINEAFVLAETKQELDKVAMATEGSCLEKAIEFTTAEVKSKDHSHAHTPEVCDCTERNADARNNEEPMVIKNGATFHVAFTEQAKKDESNIPRDSISQCTWLHKLRPLTNNWAYIIHVTGVMFFMVAQSSIVLHLPQYVRTLGTSATDAATLFMGYGVLSTASKLLAGVLTTGDRLSPLTVCTAIFALGGLSTALFPLYSATYVGQLIFACLVGTATGGYFTLINLLAVELVGVKLFAVALGAEGIFMGLGYTVGPPLAGLIVDSGGTYEHSFLFLGLSLCVAALCNVWAKFILWRYSKQSNCSAQSPNTGACNPKKNRHSQSQAV